MPRRTVTDLLYSIQQLGLEAKLIKHERHDDAIDLGHQDEIIEHTIQGENEAPHEAEAGEITPQKTELSFFAKLSQELSDWKKNPRSETNPDGYWLHPEDVEINTRLVEAMNTVIKYFGK